MIVLHFLSGPCRPSLRCEQGGCGRRPPASPGRCRAISRRIGSKPERITASGVSSMIRSIPVKRFQRPDVAPFAADDAALHLVVGQADHGDGALGDVVGGAALDGQGDDLAGPALRLLLRLRLRLLDHDRHLVFHFALDPLQEKVLGFVGVIPASRSSSAFSLAIKALSSSRSCSSSAFAWFSLLLPGLKALELLLQGLLPLHQAALDLLQLVAAFPDLPLRLGAHAMDLFFRLEGDLPPLRFRLFDRRLDDALRLSLRGLDLRLAHELAQGVSGRNGDDRRDDDSHSGGHGKPPPFPSLFSSWTVGVRRGCPRGRYVQREPSCLDSAPHIRTGRSDPPSRPPRRLQGAGASGLMSYRKGASAARTRQKLRFILPLAKKCCQGEPPLPRGRVPLREKPAHHPGDHPGRDPRRSNRP